MKGILCLTMMFACFGCTKSNDLEAAKNQYCISSMDEFKRLNNGLDTFGVVRVILEDDSEIIPAENNSLVTYKVSPSSGGNSLFNSILTVQVKEAESVRTYTATVWSKGCSGDKDVQEEYTNVMRGLDIYKVNTYFNWIISPAGAGGRASNIW